MSTTPTSGDRRRKRGGRRASQAEGAGRLTQAMENYLLSIYLVHERGLPITNSNLVEALKRVPETENLGTSPASISGMIRRMVRERLIIVGDNRYISLTAEGQRLAASIIRRHRLAARMMVDLLGLERRYVNVEAHLLEHAMSDRLEELVRRRMGDPETDPFGQPIPGSSYTEPGGAVALDRAKPGSTMVVDRIPEEDEELVAYLDGAGMLPGAEVTVDEVDAKRGVVTLHTANSDVVLGYGVAARIRLKLAATFSS